jgi:murein DD-endopeptidase MepM/ murein hydrolase activator NlpD
VSGEVIGEYAVECLSYNQTTRDWRTHDGVDFAAAAGTTVCAAADGEVYSVYEDETMGFTVVIVHDGGYTTRYCSLSEEVAVRPGDRVTAGQTIGYVGATALLESVLGEHLHFAVSCSGESQDPLAFLAGN